MTNATSCSISVSFKSIPTQTPQSRRPRIRRSKKSMLIYLSLFFRRATPRISRYSHPGYAVQLRAVQIWGLRMRMKSSTGAQTSCRMERELLRVRQARLFKIKSALVLQMNLLPFEQVLAIRRALVRSGTHQGWLTNQVHDAKSGTVTGFHSRLWYLTVS